MKRINEFLNSNPTEMEREEFYRLLASDSNLKEEYEFIMDLQSVERQQSNLKIKELLQQKESSHKRIVQLKPKKSMKWIMLAASVLFVAVTFQFLNPLNDLNNLDKIYTENFSPYPNDMVVLERGGENTNALSEIFTAYNDERYEEVVQSVDSLNIVKGTNAELLFYKAISLMALEKHTDAEKILLELDDNNLEEYGNQISWYLALISLKEQRIENALFHLNAIVNSRDEFRKASSRKLIEELKKPQN